MTRGMLLASSFLLDHLAGDPEWFPHPVRAIGLAVNGGEKLLLRDDAQSATNFLTGALLAVGIIASSYFATDACLRSAYRRSAVLGTTIELFLGWTSIAASNLQYEAAQVEGALASGNLTLARKRLSRIVGRDTAILDESEVSRALIETLAESISDGVIAPIFYLTLGGVPFAMAYKAINTLDSMIGHVSPRYLYFGKAAARLDDAANYLPARLSALCIVCASVLRADTSAGSAWRIWRRDGSLHKSPNAGQPESAMAGALERRLGGANSYDGERIVAKLMGSEFQAPDRHTAHQAMRISAAAGLLGLAICIGVAVLFTKTASDYK